jgi:hypothetical protein
MNVVRKKKIVLLGLMSHLPVAGVAWLTVQYLIGFQRLGYDVYYVEAHGCPPRGQFTRNKADDGWAKAAAYVAAVMQRFDLADRWAYHAVHGGGRCWGLSEGDLKELYRSADLIINLHGGTEPLAEHSATGRLVYLETDPVFVEVQLHDNVQKTIDLLAQHCAFFTWGLNYGNADCRVPISERFRFRSLPPPVVVDFWESCANGAGDLFTTIGNWRQKNDVWFQGELYHWSKHYEFLNFLDLPRRTGQHFELALGQFGESDRQLLEKHGWKVRRALDFSGDLDLYRGYIARSRGEFTVAKDQNVRLRSGWFSERSAQYLAAGRPVITQETGFSNVLPTGQGLFAFSSMDQIEEALSRINTDHARHSRAAVGLAHEYFNYDVVLTKMLAELGM